MEIHAQNNAITEEQSDSDSIYSSEDVGLLQPLIPQRQADVSADFQLEVVLTGQVLAGDITATENLEQLAAREGSGLAALISHVPDVGQQSGGQDEVGISRQAVESQRIMAIQQEVGITVQESREEHLIRIGVMEVRDKAEKDGWELNRVPASSL
jgi:hypothetical protein